MKRAFPIVIPGLIIIIVTIILIAMEPVKVKRAGVDEEFAEDAREVIEIVDYWCNELDSNSYDIPNEEKKILSDFGFDGGIEENEVLSPEEKAITSYVASANNLCTLHATDTDDGPRDNREDMQKNKEEFDAYMKGVGKD